MTVRSSESSNGFEEVAERLRDACPLQGLVVRIGRQEDHGDLTAIADLLGRVDPRRGRLRAGCPSAPGPGGDSSASRTASSPNGVTPMTVCGRSGVSWCWMSPGDHAIVLDDEDPGRLSSLPLPRRGPPSKVIVKVVPAIAVHHDGRRVSCCVRSSHELKTQRVGRGVTIEIGRQPDTVVSHHQDMLLVPKGLEFNAHPSCLAVRKGVLERVRDQLIHDQAARDGPVQVQLHIVDSGLPIPRAGLFMPYARARWAHRFLNVGRHRDPGEVCPPG